MTLFGNNALPLLYQSGYLTIKGYDREGEIYLLSIHIIHHT